eukprot:TRINITY_DN9742_c0_g1_i1.p1 TRINITY_DN9742_c0_g1~~TRINITY_DN9742_c0_g1_i1.p1  ORF type:complete len:568 (-),score=125.65 TRINITY_DN9742_c0_g1_i1:38-1741(-)
MLALCALHKRAMDTFECSEDLIRKVKLMDGRFVTGATLIACPNTLIRQIRTEMEYLKLPPHKCIVISTKNEHREVNSFDIIQAEFVLVSYNFLGGPYYSEKVGGKAQVEYSEAVSRSPTSVAPPLDNFHWHRIIIDEAHELFGSVDSKNEHLVLARARILKYSASLKWAITATPFSCPREQFFGYCEFLDVKIGDIPLHMIAFAEKSRTGQEIFSRHWPSEPSRDLIYNCCNDMISSVFQHHLVFRNTKKSIAQENTVPAYEEYLQFVDFTPQERALYDALPSMSDKLTVACCPPMLHSGPQYGEHLDNVYERVMRRLEGDISACHRHISDSQRQLDDGNNAANSWYRVDPSLLRKRILMYEAKLKVFVKVLSHLTREKPERRPHTSLDYTKFDDSDEFWENFRTYWGSKLTAVCRLIMTVLKSPTTKIIIFSSHNGMLATIQILLRNLDVGVGVCKGNVTMKGNLLSAFRQEEVAEDAIRVLAMSLNHTASGADLLSCTHIIMLDTLIGSKQFVISTEMQAIGRACRQGQKHAAKVVRFLCNETEEVDLYHRRQEEQVLDDEPVNE